MPGTLKLYTCSLDEGGPKLHPCRKAHTALEEAGHSYETEVFDAPGDPLVLQQIWMMRQPDAVRESYVREVLEPTLG